MTKTCLIWCALTLILGIFLGSSCHEPASITNVKLDTISKVQIVERPVFISDTIKVKSIQLKYKDYFYTDTINIPCNDTNFIAQADSIITPTNDTINMAFNYADRRGFFSLLYKPRPDSIIIRQIKTEISKVVSKTEYSWIVSALIAGIAIGVIGTAK